MSNIKSVTNVARAAKKRPFRVSIEGNIGSGKSTCIKYFEKYSNVETHAVSNHFTETHDCNLYSLSKSLLSFSFNIQEERRGLFI